MNLREAVAKYEVDRLKSSDNQFVWMLLHQSDNKRQALSRLYKSLDPENDPPELTALIREAIQDLQPAAQEPVKVVSASELPRLAQEIRDGIQHAQNLLEGNP